LAASPKHLFYSIFMNQLSVKIQTNPLILNSINDRNYFSFKSNYLLRFKKYQKETKFTNIYSKQFLTNSPFLSNKKPVQIFLKTNYKNLLFFLHFNSDCQSNRHNSILKNISTNSNDSMFNSKNSLNRLKKPIKFFEKNKTHFLNKPFQPFVNLTVVNVNAKSANANSEEHKQNPKVTLTSKFKKWTEAPFNFCLQKKEYTYTPQLLAEVNPLVHLSLCIPPLYYTPQPLAEVNPLLEGGKTSGGYMRGIVKAPIKIIFNTLFLNLLKSSIHSNKIDLLNSNFIPSKIKKYLILLYRQFSTLNQSNQYILSLFITVNLAYSMLIVYINRHFRSEFFFNRDFSSFLLTFINNFCKFKYLFLQINRSFYYSNKDYDIFDSIQFFHRQNKNNVLSQTQFDWKLINATILMKKNYFLPVQTTSKLQLLEFIKMNCAKNQFLKKYYLFYQKQVKQRNVILAEQKRHKNFDLKKLLQEQRFWSNQIKLKLWKTSKKLHNQKSFNWVFKKYGSLVNFYKQVKINVFWKQKPFFYKKNNSSQKSFKSILKTQNIFFFKNILKEKLDIGLPKKSLNKLLMFLIRKNDSSQFETLTSIEINYLSQKNIWFFKGILNLKTSHKLFLNLYQFLNLIKNQKNKYLYETYYFQD
jgi:hypothetical protein